MSEMQQLGFSPVEQGVQEEKKQPLFSVESLSYLIGASAFFIFFVWGFFSGYGPLVGALGVNMFVFYLLILGLVRALARQRGLNFSSAWPWTVPLFLIALGFALFENTFVRGISLFVFFFASLFFAGHFLIGTQEKGAKWTLGYVLTMLFSYFAAIADIFQPFRSFFSYITPKFRSDGNGKQVMRAIYGILIFIVFASVIIVPLLSAADENFKAYFHEVMKFIADLLDFLDMPKILFFLFLVAFIGGIAAYLLKRKTTIEPGKTSDKPVDGIVSGIVLGGTLFLYLIFLSLQMQYIFTGELSVNFADTEMFVKSGFWQLFVLTVINGILFVFYHGRAIPVAPLWILRLFTLSSLLLLFSAAQRVFLYDLYYGLSYEKFYASYTVLFCIGIFAWFVYLIFSMRESNLLKVVLFASLWMYAVSAVFPIERFVFATNVALSQKEDSRVQLLDLRDFTLDSAGYVMKNFDTIVKLSDKQKEFLCRTDSCYEGIEHNSALSWNKWLEERQTEIQGAKEDRDEYSLPHQKEWFEYSFMALLNRDVAPVKVKQSTLHFESKDVPFTFEYPSDWSVREGLDAGPKRPVSTFVSNDNSRLISGRLILSMGDDVVLTMRYDDENSFGGEYRYGIGKDVSEGYNEPNVIQRLGEFITVDGAKGERVRVYSSVRKNVVSNQGLLFETDRGIVLFWDSSEMAWGDKAEKVISSVRFK